MKRSLAIAAVGVAGLALAGPAAADQKTVKVAHGAVTANLVPVTPGVSSPGDLRTYWIKLTKPGKTKKVGLLTGSLLTTAVDKPGKGKELRTANLVFSIGRPDDQLIVGGVAEYDQAAPTLNKRTEVVRPVIGGSGKYDGARGYCTSIHRKDNTWVHVFTVDVL